MRCPACGYEFPSPVAQAGGRAGGVAKVAKGFAVAGQPSAAARKRGWRKRKRLHSVVLRCESCGNRAKAPGPSAIASRGYWWHRPCAKMLDADTVDFPSGGKLCPRTILTQNAAHDGRLMEDK